MGTRQQLSLFSTERDHLFNQLIDYYIEDEKITPSEIKDMYFDRGYISDYFTLAEIYLGEKDFSNAYDMILQVEQENQKNSDILEEVKAYNGYISILEDYDLNGMSIYNLEAENLAQLENFALSGYGRANRLAHNILCALYDICLEDISPKSLKQPHKFNSGQNNTLQHVKVQPNPAQLYVTFDWKFDSFIDKGTLIIYDISGKPLVRHPLNALQGQWIWNTTTIPNGVYTYAVMDGKHTAESGKVIIQK